MFQVGSIIGIIILIKFHIDKTIKRLCVPYLLSIVNITKFADVTINITNITLVPQNNFKSCFLINIDKFGFNYLINL